MSIINSSATSMSLQVIAQIALTANPSSSTSVSNIRDEILEYSDIIRLEAARQGESYPNGSNLMEFCVHLMTHDSFKGNNNAKLMTVMLLLCMQTNNLSEKVFEHVVRLFPIVLRELPSISLAGIKIQLTQALRNLVTTAQNSSVLSTALIQLLLASVESFQNLSNPNTLTPAHALFARTCVSAQMYDYGCSKLSSFSIYEVDPSNTGLTPLDCLLYFYYSGICYVGMKKFTTALGLFSQAISYPGDNISAVMLSSLKKAKLVALIETGKKYHIPAYTSYDLIYASKSATMTSMSAYDKLETAFIEGKTKDIAKVMQEFRNDFIADRNLGLVKQVLDAHFNHSILKVKSAYSKISISKICLLLGSSDESIVKSRLISLASRNVIPATINERNGMVSFHDSAVSQSSDIIEMVRDSMATTMDLTARFYKLRKSIITSKSYIGRSFKSSNKGQGISSTAMSVDDDAYFDGGDDVEM